jgi:hypothetical protein
LDWVKQQQKADRERENAGGLLATTGLAIGASVFGAFELALVFGAVGMLQGGIMSADGLHQAGVNLDAVQAGGAGGKRLTAANPHQAQMDYQMAMVNVGLSLLDAKVAVSSIKQVLASRGAVQALGKLNPAQVEQLAEATRLEQVGKAVESKGLFQQLREQVGEKIYKEIRKVNRILRASDPEAGMIRMPGGKEPAPKGLVNVVEEEPTAMGRWFARYGPKTGAETFSARLESKASLDLKTNLESKTNRLEISWTDPVTQLTDNLAEVQAEVQRTTGRNISEISGNASDRFLNKLRNNKFDHKLYERALSKRLGGKWKVEMPRRLGYELVDVQDAAFDIKAIRIGD